MINNDKISINKICLEVSHFIRCMRKYYQGHRMSRIVFNGYLNEIGASYGVQLTDKVGAADRVEVTNQVATTQGIQVPLDKVRPAELIKVFLYEVATSDGVQVSHQIPSTKRVQVTNKVATAE